MLDAKQKATRILIAVFVANCVLVATHVGEFWPFSIYPMFSRADTEVHQVLVRQLDEEEQENEPFDPVAVSDLPGEEYGVRNAGVEPVDLNKYVRLTEHWDGERLSGLVRMFRDDLNEERLLLFDVKGDAVEDKQENYQARPLVYFDKSGGRFVGPDELGER